MQLDRLQERTQADSLSEVIRRALALYDFVSEETSRGASVVVRAEDGQEQRVVVL